MDNQNFKLAKVAFTFSDGVVYVYDIITAPHDEVVNDNMYSWKRVEGRFQEGHLREVIGDESHYWFETTRDAVEDMLENTPLTPNELDHDIGHPGRDVELGE